MSEQQQVIGMDQLSHLALSARFYGEWQRIITTAGAAGEHGSETVRARLVPFTSCWHSSRQR